MLAEAIIENDEMRIVKFPREAFRGKRWTVNIEPIREITDDEVGDGFDSEAHERLWVEEAAARYDAYKRGDSKSYPATEAIREIRDSLQ